MATVVPGVTSSSVTVPACGAEMTCSIFIASTTSRLWPAATVVADGHLDDGDRAGHGRGEGVGAAAAAPPSAAATGSYAADVPGVAVPAEPVPAGDVRVAKVCVDAVQFRP